MTVEDEAQELADIAHAAEAVAYACRPGMRRDIHTRQIGEGDPDDVEDVEGLLYHALSGYEWERLGRAQAWWGACGPDVTFALCHVIDDLEEKEASHVVGAAMWAHILAGADLVADSVLRLAERAACWEAGRRK